MILLNLSETHLSSWHKVHPQPLKRNLTASKPVCWNKRSQEASEAVHRQKTKRKTRLKQGQNCQGEKKGHLWSQLYQL